MLVRPKDIYRVLPFVHVRFNQQYSAKLMHKSYQYVHSKSTKIPSVLVFRQTGVVARLSVPGSITLTQHNIIEQCIYK